MNLENYINKLKTLNDYRYLEVSKNISEFLESTFVFDF